MSQDQDYENSFLNGKYLSKSELKLRLEKMEIELDNKAHSKAYYIELYNK